MWGDPNAQKNGRSGQNQNGVDVVGRSAYDGLLHGVQCKGKNTNYGSELKEQEITDEADNADDFDKQLATLTMATTSPRDEKLQQVCRDLNKSGKHRFTVSVWSWDDIEDELQYRSDILKHLKMDFDDEESEKSSIKVSRVTSKERLQAFMTRPIILAVTSMSMRLLLYHVFYEIMQNAFVHGKATHCMLMYDNCRFTLMNDGTMFNPDTLREIKGNGGAMTVVKLFSTCGSEITSNYEYKDDEGSKLNVYSLAFSLQMLGKDISNSNRVELIVNQQFEIQGRVEAERLAIEQMSSISPTDMVDVLFGNIVANSNIRAYVKRAAQIIGADRLTVSLHSSQSDLTEQLKEYTPNITVR